MSSSKGSDRWIGGCLLFLAIVIFVYAYQFPPTRFEIVGPGFMPQIMAVCLGVLSIALIASARKGDAEEASAEAPQSSPFAVVLLLLLIYVGILRLVGFRAATFVFLVSCMTVLSGEVKKLPRFALLSLGLVLIIYYVFHNLMGIFLPRGSIFV